MIFILSCSSDASNIFPDWLFGMKSVFFLVERLLRKWYNGQIWSPVKSVWRPSVLRQVYQSWLEFWLWLKRFFFVFLETFKCFLVSDCQNRWYLRCRQRHKGNIFPVDWHMVWTYCRSFLCEYRTRVSIPGASETLGA